MALPTRPCRLTLYIWFRVNPAKLSTGRFSRQRTPWWSVIRLSIQRPFDKVTLTIMMAYPDQSKPSRSVSNGLTKFFNIKSRGAMADTADFVEYRCSNE
jgi:hypothetical protein